MIRLRQDIDVVDMLKQAGYSTYLLRGKAKEGEPVLSQDALQNLAAGKLPSWKTLDKLCGLLGCTPMDLIDYQSNADLMVTNDAIDGFCLLLFNDEYSLERLFLHDSDSALFGLIRGIIEPFKSGIKFDLPLSDLPALRKVLSSELYSTIVSQWWWHPYIK